MIKILKKLIFVTFTICISLVILELAFRLMYSIKYKDFSYMAFGFKNILTFNVGYYKGYIKLEEVPETEGEIFNGFRTPPFLIKKPEGEYRIIALGGSSTYGINNDYYHSWPYFLEKKLNSESEGLKYRVINCGVPGQTTYGVDKLLGAEIFDLDPDTAIIYSLYNHLNFDTPQLLINGNKFIGRSFRFAMALFYDKSLLATYLINLLGVHMSDKMKSYRDILTDIIVKCKEKGVNIIVVKQLINPGDVCFTEEKNARFTADAKTETMKRYKAYLIIIDEVCNKYDCEVVDFSAFSPVFGDRLKEMLPNDQVHINEDTRMFLADVISEKIIK